MTFSYTTNVIAEEGITLNTFGTRPLYRPATPSRLTVMDTVLHTVRYFIAYLVARCCSRERITCRQRIRGTGLASSGILGEIGRKATAAAAVQQEMLNRSDILKAGPQQGTAYLLGIRRQRGHQFRTGAYEGNLLRIQAVGV